MKILFVVHQFLPGHQAGTELYAYWLAKALQRAGHDARLFFTEIHPDRQPYEWSRGTYDGLPFYEAVHNRAFPTFRHTYMDAEMERVFEAVLDDFMPDVVHFQHLYLHSIGYVDVARSRALPMFFTLHEYMLACLRSGLLLRPDSSLCPGPERGACAVCAEDVFATAGKQGALRALWQRSRRRSAPERGSLLPEVELRQREIAARLEHVDLFLAPSAYLRDRFLEFGLVREDQIVKSENGIVASTEPTAPGRVASQGKGAPPTSAAARLRVGFIGTVAEHKGVHILVEAMAGIEDPGVTCAIHGPLDYFPDYVARLRKAPGIDRVSLEGGVPRAKIPNLLSELDVLVVPSLWPENAPLTIQEAFLCGVPVVASNAGGMAELVQDGVNGLHFALGDAADLRTKLLRLRDEEDLLARLRTAPTVVRSSDEDAAVMSERYATALRVRSSRAADDAPEPDVTIFIPTFDAGPAFPGIFKRIKAQEFDGTFEVLVVDSGSRDGTVEFLKERDVRVIEIPNTEFNHGLTRNLGVSQARGKIVVLMTQDAEPYDSHWLQQLVDCFADEDVVGAYSCQLPKPDADLFMKDRLSNWAAAGSKLRVQQADRQAFEALAPLDKLECVTFDNVSSAIRRSCAEELPFRKRQFGEDIDWAHRAILAGHKLVFQPGSKVIHSHDNSAWYEFKRVYLDHQNLHRVFGVHTVPRKRDVLRCSAAAIRHLSSVVDAAALPATEALRWKARAIGFGFSQNLAQHLGAASVARLERGGVVAQWIDRVLRQAV